jgi:hypothetical protein
VPACLQAGVNVIMDNPLWDRLLAEVRLHVDGLILAGQKMAAIAAILDGAPAPRRGLPGSVQVIAGRYGDLGLGSGDPRPLRWRTGLPDCHSAREPGAVGRGTLGAAGAGGAG